MNMLHQPMKIRCMFHLMLRLTRLTLCRVRQIIQILLRTPMKLEEMQIRKLKMLHLTDQTMC